MGMITNNIIQLRNQTDKQCECLHFIDNMKAVIFILLGLVNNWNVFGEKFCGDVTKKSSVWYTIVICNMDTCQIIYKLEHLGISLGVTSEDSYPHWEEVFSR